METLDAIFTRRSIRRYTNQTIPEEILQQLLQVGMFAPSANNTQPWHIVVLTDRDKLNRLAAALPYGKMLAQAPLGFVVCADTHLDELYWVQDCAAATQNILLAAHALGLGAVWIAVYPREERIKPVTELLALPKGVTPMCTIAMGYPAVTAPKANRYQESRVHYNTW